MTQPAKRIPTWLTIDVLVIVISLAIIGIGIGIGIAPYRRLFSTPRIGTVLFPSAPDHRRVLSVVMEHG